MLVECSKAEIRFGTWEHMLPPPEKIFSKCQKITKKNLALTSRHSMCIRQVSRKTDIFCVFCKKKKKSRAMPILAPNFVFFTYNTKKCRFLVKQLRENIECRELHAKKIIRIFGHFKLCLKHISKTGSKRQPRSKE
jgi:hypothetical protein